MQWTCCTTEYRHLQIKGSPFHYFSITGSLKDNPSTKISSVNSSRSSGSTNDMLMLLRYIYMFVCVCVCVWCVHTEIGFDWTQWVLENNQFDCLMSVCYFLYSFLFLYLGYREEDNEGQKHIVWSFWFGPKCLIIDLFEKQVL